MDVIMVSHTDPLGNLLSRLANVKKSSEADQWTACCPAHKDDHPSLSISQSNDGKILLYCHASCSYESILSALDMKPQDLSPPFPNGHKPKIVATYGYRDEAGRLLFQVVRLDPKGFRQRRPDGNGGWIWKLEDTRRVLYRLPELLAADPKEIVFVVEGEKDVENLHRMELVATTNPGGARKWRKEYGPFLKGRTVVILPDNDKQGKEHAQAVAKALAGIATVKILELPGLPDKGDVSDWIRDGGDRKKLLALVDSSPSPHGKPKKTRLLEPYRPFPVDCLPEPLKSFVVQGSTALGCDPALIALPILAVVGSAIGNSRVLRLKHSWSEPSIFWATVVSESGTLKSPAQDLAVRPVHQIQKRLMGDFKIAYARYVEEVQRHSEAKGKGEDVGEEPKEPTLQRIVVSDITVEKLAEVLESNKRGILLSREELNGWLSSFSRYRGRSGGTDLPNWLELHRAGTLVVDRKSGTKQTLFIQGASVSLVGGVQPSVLAKVLTPEYLESGLAARLLLAMPPRRKKAWSEVEIHPDIAKAYEGTIEALLRLEMDEDRPHVLRLSPEGKTAWIEFYNRWGQEQADAEGELASAFSKLEGYAARLALLHHVVVHSGLDTTDLRPVSLASVKAGVALTMWFAAEAKRIYAMLAESPDQRATRQLVEYIQGRGGRITARGLQRSNAKKYPTAEHAEEALDQLVKDGWGEWVQQHPTEKGGHPTRLFTLCPTVDTTSPNCGETEVVSDEGGQKRGVVSDAPPQEAPRQEKTAGFYQTAEDGPYRDGY